jgi:hypothetical protein
MLAVSDAGLFNDFATKEAIAAALVALGAGGGTAVARSGAGVEALRGTPIRLTIS